MEDIRKVLSQFKKKKDGQLQKSQGRPSSGATTSEIPDVFFDFVLLKIKLNRLEIALYMHLYRQVWCRPNLYRSHGIGPLNSYSDICQKLNINVDELGTLLRNLENYGLIETVRAGQYFIRKYFLEEIDLQYSQNYDEFL